MITSRVLLAIHVGLAISVISVHAKADDGEGPATPWFLKVGPASVGLNISARAEAPPGTVVPGAQLGADDGASLGFEFGYQFAEKWAGHLLVGVPIKTNVQAKGTLAPVGKAGELTYGPAVMSVTYEIVNLDGFRPYVGAGATYLVVFNASDAGISGFKVKNSWGSSVELGFDYDLNKRYSLFADVKKVFLKTDVSGNVPAFGGVAAYARATVDPLIIQVGFGYKF